MGGGHLARLTERALPQWGAGVSPAGKPRAQSEGVCPSPERKRRDALSEPRAQATGQSASERNELRLFAVKRGTV